MSNVKLTNTIKQLIAARGSPLQPGSGPSSSSADQLRRQLLRVLDDLQSTSRLRASRNALLTLATGTFFSINSPASLQALWKWSDRTVEQAELIREAGLKSISFIGIAKVINNLAVVNECFQEEGEGLKGKLRTRSRRDMWSESVNPTFHRGRQLWNSIYTPHHEKLVGKLASYHPDLPVHILESHYSLLLSDPTSESAAPHPGPLGRVLTSVLAVACLQGQQGVGSQVTSHIFGLLKAGEESSSEGSLQAEGLTQSEKDWLCSPEGAEWVLKAIESLREVVLASSSAEPADLSKDLRMPRRESKL